MTVAARIIAWLGVGHLIIGALFWALLQVPESTSWMVALTGLLALFILVLAAVVESVAIRWWQTGDTGREHVVTWRRIVPSVALGRALAGFAVALLMFLALYWLTGRMYTWWSAYGGQVDAWMMMRTRSPRAAWLHVVVEWTIWVLRYPVALSLSVGMLGACLTGMPRPARWVPNALHWRPILGISLSLLIFVMLPWRYVYWRPALLPANWLEPLFVGTKLLIVYVLMNTGWAIVLSAGARQVD